MTVLYVISKILTFPGAYLKSFFEHLVCRLIGVPIESARYMRADELCGHMEHELADSRTKSVCLCLFPGLFTFLLGAPLAAAGWLNICWLGVTPKALDGSASQPMFWAFLVMLYVGVSLLCNLFPLTEDALWLWQKLYRDEEKPANIIFRIILFIPSIIMEAGSFFERFGLQVLVWAVFILYSALFM